MIVPGRDLLTGGRPALQTFDVSGFFEVGLQDHDGSLVLVPMQDAAELAGDAAGSAGIRLRFDDVMAAPVRAMAVAAALGPGFEVRDWSREHAAYFRAIRIEKTMMSLILMLVVAVAAFNIVAALVMVVNEKRSDIAILRTLGLSAAWRRGRVSHAGAGDRRDRHAGWDRARSAGREQRRGDRTRAGGRTRLPRDGPDRLLHHRAAVSLRVGQVAAISSIAFLLTVLATIYPAMRGAATEPAEALR